MQIRVLGCSGSIAAGCRTTAFLLDDDVLIDAGTGVGDLTLEQLERIDHILLSHSHLDHVLAVPLLADSVMRRRAGRPPIQVHALQATLDTLRRHLFNGALWPDFTRLPSAEHPVLALQAFETGQVLSFSGGRRIEVLPALHTVPAVGFAVMAPEGSGRGAWVYTGDTAPEPALWRRLEALPTLVAALAWARATSIVRVQPGFVESGGTRVLTLPGDPTFPTIDGWEVPEETRFILQEGGAWLPTRG